jgi:hypothetical protein
MAFQRSSIRRWGVEMAIRKPTLTVQEARRLSSIRPEGNDTPPRPADVAEAPEPVLHIVATATLAEPPASLMPVPPLPAEAVLADTVPVVQPETAVESQILRERALRAAPAGGSPAKSSALTPAPVLQNTAPAQNVARIQVFVSANVPAPGVSASFDLLSRQYPPEKALQMILRRALDDYEDRLADGTFQNLPDSYASDGKLVVQTSRIMPKDLVEVSRSHFDPLGFESTRAFGLKLASAALASFFAAEKKRRHGTY